ncbi:TIM-barrel domain-containing protein [Edaphobacter bradus]|uniref:TIM-barrel domain-containing protein n=1 Tax=Edaphobacter bradus TaxID=2259016 RepID=UPI0021DFCDD0|nr:TIM-barrel domain-containing protein [Edaphobacter bradus]
MSTQISRRSLAKALAASGTALSMSRLGIGQTTAPELLAAHGWEPVHPGVWRATFGTPEKFTPVASRLVPPQVAAFAKLPRVETAPLPPLTARRMGRGCTLQIPLKAGEQIFGLGLQLLSFAQRGRKRVARVNADPKADSGDSHAPVPFYVTTEGYGVLIDTARYATFYFGNAHPKPTQPVAAVAGASVDPKYSNTSKDASNDFVMVDVPDVSGVDVYLFAGPDMLGAVRRYNVFSGGGFVPPEWGLGFWYRNMAKAGQTDVLAMAREFRDRHIPCDVIGLEPGWQSHAYSCSFVWDKDRFPDPSGFLRAAADQHYKINLWEHAFTHPSSPLFPQLEPYSGNFGVWQGLVPDFVGERARAIFGDYHGKTLIEAGVNGFKLDECDNSDYTHGWSFPECSSFPSGVDGEQMHSVFGLRYQMAIWNEFRKRGRETYGMVRSSGALATPYPFVLYSDLYNHRDYIRALVNSGFSGLLWCPEVRQADSVEDLIRRLQSVVFSSLAQVDCWYMKNPPWKQVDRKLNNADQLIENWEALEARCREIIGWRMQLVPYLTAAFQRYADDGTPPFRALVLDAPQDNRLHTVDDQYMVGDRMMVAPLFAGEPSRKVIMPEGQWHDFWSGEPIKGGSEISVRSSQERIPVYVKSGSIVPWANVGLFAGAPETRRITARVYGDGSLPFSLLGRNGTLRLSWRNKSGIVDGKGSGYNVYAWTVIG